MMFLARRIAIALIAITAILAYTSAFNDAAIVDEDPHIGAGISYLTQQDMRLNPEHPPLVKDLAALPLLAIPNLVVPITHPSWTNDVNGQWDFGRAFLFQSGNDADLILRLARIAPIGIMVLLFAFVFRVGSDLGGPIAGILSLLFAIFNPVVLAHGRFVTTDVAAAAGIFIATYAFLRYLADPSWKRLLVTGVAFGIAELTKFSAILLVPYFAILAILRTVLAARISRRSDGERGRRSGAPALERIGGTIAIGLIGLVIIYGVYAWHIAHYPPERQVRDTAFILASFPNQTIAEMIVALARRAPLRPIAQYLLGLAMVVQRASGGNTTYFLGEVSASGWAWYFPTVYLIKIPLAFHIFTLIACGAAIAAVIRARRRPDAFERAIAWLDRHFAETAMLLFLALYWYTSLTSNLNIGVRHLMPTFPFTFVLVALGIRHFLRLPALNRERSSTRMLREIIRTTILASARQAIVAILILWLVIAGLRAWPFYLASFNELAALRRDGGAGWVVDSNLDWGQDLKRLAAFVRDRGITTIAIDYFGWTPPEYYIRTARVIPWSKDKGQPSGWFAVSATFRQQWCARPAPGFEEDTTGYCFLERFTPERVIGGSIYVYHLP